MKKHIVLAVIATAAVALGLVGEKWGRFLN